MPENRGKLTKFWQELKRRNVFRVTATYAATAYIIIEVINNLAVPLQLPLWVSTLILILLAIGLPIAVILSWIFDITLKGIKKTESLEELAEKEIITRPGKRRLKASDIIIAVLFIAVIILAWPRIFKRDTVKRLASSGEKIAVAVMPFQNMTNNTTWNIFEDAIQMSLISAFSNTVELEVRQIETMNELMKTKGFTDYATISPDLAFQISHKLNADIYITGSIQQAGSLIRVDAQLIDTKTKKVFKSFKEERLPLEENIIPLIDTLAKEVIDFLQISKLIKEYPWIGFKTVGTNSPEALRNCIYGEEALAKFDLPTAINFYLRATAADSNYLQPKLGLISAYRNSGMNNKAFPLILKLYAKRDQMSPVDKLRISFLYARDFEPPDVQVRYLRQLQEIDDYGNYHYALANAYGRIKQPDKAITEMEKSLEVSRKWGREFLQEHYAYPALGEAYHRKGQYKKEKRLYREAERVNDDHRSEYFSWVIRNQASLALTEGDTMAANKYIDELLSVFRENSISDYQVEMYLALMYRVGGDRNKAIEYYRKAYSSSDENPDRLNSIAYALINNDLDVNEGLEIIEKAITLEPGRGGFLDAKGWGLYKLGKYNEALEVLEKSRDMIKPRFSYEISNHIEEVKKAIAEQK